MKLCFARALAGAVLPVCLAVSSARAVHAQSTSSVTRPVQTQQAPPAASDSKGQVIFSRSTDENGDTKTTAGRTVNGKQVTAPVATDAERAAVTYTKLDMDVRLRPAVHQIAVRAQLTVRNDGKTPLAHLPLQLSSSLHWERIRIAGKDASFTVATLNSDADHTGQLHEAAVDLVQPLAPGATMDVDATYSGTIEATARRLLTIGTPDDVAARSDWDQIDASFTGLRGFGNVVWYPVSSIPVILGDGARLFDEMGEHKVRLTGAWFHLRLTVEFPAGQAPTVALVNGHPAKLTIADQGAPASDVPGIAVAETETTQLASDAPSLFVAIRHEHAGTNVETWTTTDNDVNQQFWLDAARDVTPFLQGWLGDSPRTQLTLLDLPDAQDAPFETGALLAAGLRDARENQLDPVLVHALTHAWLASPRSGTLAWMSEGTAQFMSTLWTEKQQGRDKALSALEAGRTALALAEPGSPGESAGQPLPKAISPAYYRTKAAYVFWMLRDLAGDPALQAAFRAYDPARDLGDARPCELETLLEKSGAHPDLRWFFADWVDADKGLPDLSIQNVFPTAEKAGNWIAAVDVANAGYAAANVPVTVRSGLTSITQRVQVPARGHVTQRILIQGRPTEVQVNDGTVPETQATVHVTRLEDAAPEAPTGPTAPQP